MKSFIVFLLLTVGCSTVEQPLDAQYFYKRDLRMKANDDKAMRDHGVLVLPKLPKYNLKIRSIGRLDLLTISSCHREIVLEPGGVDTVNYEYVPVGSIEQGYCPLRLAGYDKKNGKHSWGFIDFQDGVLNPSRAKIVCNGEIIEANGVGACQSKEGLVQELMFPQYMTVNPDPDCEFPRKIADIYFQIPLKKAECVYLFYERENKGDRKYFRLTTLGYERVILLKD